MASSSFLIASLLICLYPSLLLCDKLPPPPPPPPPSTNIEGNLRTYIIQVVEQNINNVQLNGSNDMESWYKSFLPPQTTTTSNSAEPRLVHTYSEAFSGFAARLTDEEVKEMAKKEGFVRAYQDEILTLHTTHSPDFLGLRLGGATAGRLWNASNFGKGVIIGLLDTGITPNHPSFHDDGMSPPPARWKGKCEFDRGSCNNKIIGATTHLSAVEEPLFDENGHGTHTASTAAGNFVKNANVFGLGDGTAAGMAPHAHLAMYKVCSRYEGCRACDVLSGLESAIKDGVDVISISISVGVGGSGPHNYVDPVAIAALRATHKGITVVCSAGNDGPSPRSISNDAPWILTVAASTVDRSFRSIVKLGDGRQFNGESLTQSTNFSSIPFPLVYSGSQSHSFTSCNLVDGNAFANKVVACNDEFDCPDLEYCSDAVGMIKISKIEHGYTIAATAHSLPVVQVTSSDGIDIISYARSADQSSPKVASLAFSGTVLGTSPAPAIGSFSSRGPSLQFPGILKPDISAPGVNILAAWSTNLSSEISEGNNAGANYNIISGTSMSAPHVSGIVALIKSLRSDWSPARIKSAILTSSDANDRDGNPIKDEKLQFASFFAMGAGHVNPSKAAEPGLVYDLNADDYIAYLTGGRISEEELNYPSIVMAISSVGASATVNRTVTNVGDANAKYKIEVDMPKGVLVNVKPKTLKFSKVNEKKTYTVTASVRVPYRPHCFHAEGNLKWVSKKKMQQVVRSPLIIASKIWLDNLI